MAAKAAAPASAFDSPEHQKAKEAFKKVNRRAAADANDAIAILERRAQSATKEIELPGGDIIPIRARLPRTEMQRCSELFHTIAEAHQVGDAAAAEAASNALLGHILYVDGMSPVEIAAWLAGNPQSFSDVDAGEIVLAFGQLVLDEKARQERIATFRRE